MSKTIHREADALPTILILEDEVMTALDLEGMCVDFGYRVIGPYGSLDQANSAVDALDACDMPTHALLDVDVVGGTSYTLASRLEALGVAVTFVTAQSREVLRRLPCAKIVDKPFCRRSLGIHLASA